MNMFYLGKNVKEAVDAPRIHHQLFPMNLFYEDGTTTVSRTIIKCRLCIHCAVR